MNKLTIEKIRSTKDLGVALKRFRKYRGFTQTELAKKVNIRQATISELEQGRGTLETFIKLILALKVNLALTDRPSIKVQKNGPTEKILKMMED